MPFPTPAEVYWLFGLPCAGKTTLACALQTHLVAAGRVTQLLDGDVLRQGLCQDLGFSNADRQENLRRAAEVARLFIADNRVVIAAFITPLRENRDMIRRILHPVRLRFIHVRCSLETCMKRDVKGHYRMANAGLIPAMTGAGSAFEPPAAEEDDVNTIETENDSIEICVSQILG